MRRIQLRLKSERDFQTATELLKTLGCPLIDSPKATVVEPKAATPRPTSAATSCTLPSSAISERIFDRSDISEAVAHYAKSKERHSAPYAYSLFDVGTAQARKISAENYHATRGSNVGPQRSNEHLDDIHPLFPQTLSSVSHASQAKSQRTCLQPAPPLASTDPRSSAHRTSGGQHPAPTFPSSPPAFNRTYSDVLMGPPSMRPPMQPRPHSARDGDTMATFNDESFPTLRPVTVPIAQSPMTLSQMIPRRDLPFDPPLRSTSTPREADLASSRRASSVLELSPLPRPALIGEKRDSSITGVERTFDRPKKRPLSVASSIDNNRSSSTEVRWAEKNMSSRVLHNRSPPATPGVRIAEDKVAPNQLPLRQLSQSESNISRSSPPQGAAKQAKDATFRPSDLSKHPSLRGAAPLEASMFMQALVTELSDLAAYVTQSAEDRHQIIQDLISQNIADENFLQLCDDVNGQWRRIGFDI